MAVLNPTDASKMAELFAAVIRSASVYGGAIELWFRQRGKLSELWLVTEPIDFDREQHFYEASKVLYQRFPDTFIDFRVVNPMLFSPFDISAVIPADAECFPLH